MLKNVAFYSKMVLKSRMLGKYLQGGAPGPISEELSEFQLH